MKNLSGPAETAKGGAVWGAPGSLQLCREVCTQLWGAKMCHWLQQGRGEGKPREDGFGTGVLWMRVSSFLPLVIL